MIPYKTVSNFVIGSPGLKNTDKVKEVFNVNFTLKLYFFYFSHGEFLVTCISFLRNILQELLCNITKIFKF